MERNDDIVETNSCKRQRVSEEQVIDRISSLPDPLIVHILSFLPTEDAVKTVLIRRFGKLWTFVSRLSFDQCSYHDCADIVYSDDVEYDERFLDFVHNVLILHENPTIDQFILKLDYNLLRRPSDEGPNDYVDREMGITDKVNSWVHFAIRKKVELLHLDFKGCGELEPDAYILPDVVMNCQYLTQLKLVACEIIPTGQIKLNSLKRLFLEEIDLKGEILNQILCGSSVLEELSLVKCYSLHTLAFKKPSIKSLIVEFEPISSSLRLRISCPNLVSLQLAGFIESVDLVDVSSLAVSSIFFSFHSKCALGRNQEIRRVFQKLSRSKLVKLCTWSIMVFTTWQLNNLQGLFFRWKCLEFSVVLSKWHHMGISCLLRSSPYLETLTIYIGRGLGQHLVQVFEEEWAEYDLDMSTFWSSQVGSFHCLQYHLKTITIYGLITEPYVIDFIEFLLKKAMVLESLVISTDTALKPPQQPEIFGVTYCYGKKDVFTTEKRLEFSQKLLSLPRVSKRAVIQFS
ncbi:hypothetical protein COLO4_33627 [Corchorus olitorius]|uniref:FBD domain-containing protein n=1 Tax=Corchorus olitorius TaxID=93759 RepID=A0A1R3GSH2_9ROSI|nr:hypothetical protein COLO4_33627 [Corchorus olitorius]